MAPTASTRATTASARSPTAPESSRRIRSTSSRSARDGLRLEVVEVDDVERLDEQRLAGVGGVVDDAGHAAPGARLHGEHGPAAALGDEILLQVLAEAARPDELLELLVHALSAGAQPDAQLAELSAMRCPADRSRRPRSRAGSTRRAARAPGRSRRRARAGAARPSRDRRELHARGAPRRSCRPRSAMFRLRARRRVPRVPRARGRRAALRAAARPQCRSSETASAVSAWRRATSPGSADGSRERASSAPWELAVALASRSAIAGNSRASSAFAIHATSVGRFPSSECADMSVATHKNWNGG